MYRISLLLAALLLCTAPACAESDSLISDDLIRKDTVYYANTETVGHTVFEKNASTSATVYLPYLYSLKYEGDGAKFSEYLVKRNDEVHAGDVLAVFTTADKSVEIASAQMDREHAEKDYADGKKQKEEQLKTLRGELSGTADAWEKQLKALAVEKAEIELERYCYQQEKKIADLAEKLAELEEEAGKSTLEAPIDGVISEVTYKRVGDRVFWGEVLITMYSTENALLKISNDRGAFRYGMPVTIELGPRQSRIKLNGTVVGADNLLPEKRRTGAAYIQVEPFDETGVKITQISVSAKTAWLDGVLVIPRRAMTMEAGKYYVNILTDENSLKKRSVKVALTTSTQAWILQGLSEGQTIVID